MLRYPASCLFAFYDASRVEITFILPDDSRKTVQAKVGDTLLDVVVNQHVPADGFGMYLPSFEHQKTSLTILS